MVNSQLVALSCFQWISRRVMRMVPIAKGTATQMRAEDVIWAAWPDHWPASIQPKVWPVFTQLPAC
jgi:hypothetical protein